MAFDGGERTLDAEPFGCSAQELYDASPCALLSTLPTGEIIRANTTFFAWLGAPSHDVLGTVRFQSLLTMGSRIYYETHYAPLLQMQGFVSEIALEIRRQDGTSCPVVASAKQVKDDAGAPVVNHVALFDSSDRRRYEKELLQERKRAEEVSRVLADADRRKSEFIAVLAHELRNPLAPIRTALDLQRRIDLANNVVNKTNEMMRRQVGQMVRLVEDLLDVTRIGHSKLLVRPVPVDLVSVVRHAIEDSEFVLHEAHLRVETQLPAAPIYAAADAARLIQVIGNILHNAAKFTPADGRVHITLDQHGSDAQIAIRDTGIGIPADKLPHVFDLFMQATPSADRRGGLGLGLRLAKVLVEEHGGRITVRSEGPGTGSEFVVQLPALAEAPASVSRSVTPPSPATPLAPRRILVVDDNRDSADMMVVLLELHGHEVRQAHDGFDAIEVTRNFRPEVVLLDIGLPGLNGYQVAQRIRADGGDQPVLVALTGWGQEEDRRRSKDAGFDAHVVKPIDHEVLMRLLVQSHTGAPSPIP